MEQQNAVCGVYLGGSACCVAQEEVGRLSS